MDIIDIFKEPMPIDENYVFVIMPFEEFFKELYETVIYPAVVSKGFKCQIADQPTNNTIIHDIITSIKKARFIVADISNQNPNVMYELGIAHALQKEVIIIYDVNSKKLPFDVIYIRARMYDNNAPGGIRLKSDLEDTIEYVRGKIQSSQLSEEFRRARDQQSEELFFMVRSHFRQRSNRVDYFTYHIIDLMFHARSQYIDLKNEIEEYRLNPTDDEWNKIKRGAKHDSEFLKSYTMDFTIFQLDNAKNFLHSAWLSIKFPDELNMLNWEMAGLENVHITKGSIHFHDEINQIIRSIDYRISRIDFWIQIMQEEREIVGLKSVEDKYGKKTF